MIELPETYVLAEQINNTLVGKTIARVQAMQTPHGFAFFRGDPQGYAPALEGLKVAGAAAATSGSANATGAARPSMTAAASSTDNAFFILIPPIENYKL